MKPSRRAAPGKSKKTPEFQGLPERTGSTALVTGAGSGIGRAIALRLARDGRAVASLDIDSRAAVATAREIEGAGGRAIGIACDVSKSPAVERAFARATRELGPIEVLVNNAGVGGPFHRVDEVSDEEWDWIMGTNVKGAFLLSRLALPIMKRRGFGRILQIASIQGLLGSARSSTYVASKHAMIGYARSIAAEWGAFGITCNAICPGYVDTRMGAQKKHAALKSVIRRTPAGRVARPEEIASLASWIAGRESGYLNGAVIAMDGGITAEVGLR